MAVVSKGFTLLELLVSISIIGILLGIISASFITGQKRSRDTKRLADLLAIQQSLEQCYVLNSLYPAAITPGQALTCGLQTTMSLIPLDPKNSGSYAYTYSPTANKDGYCLCALLEQNGVGNANTAGANGACSLSLINSNYQCSGSQQ